jgi:hypothetical protein
MERGQGVRFIKYLPLKDVGEGVGVRGNRNLPQIPNAPSQQGYSHKNTNAFIMVELIVSPAGAT